MQRTSCWVAGPWLLSQGCWLGLPQTAAGGQRPASPRHRGSRSTWTSSRTGLLAPSKDMLQDSAGTLCMSLINTWKDLGSRGLFKQLLHGIRSIETLLRGIPVIYRPCCKHKVAVSWTPEAHQNIMQNSSGA